MNDPNAMPSPLQQALLVAALARGRSRLTGTQVDEPTHLLIENLLALGVAIVIDESVGTIDVAGTGGYWPNSDAELRCNGDFPLGCLLMAACGIGHGQYTVLPGTPVSDDAAFAPLVDALADLGAAVHYERTGDRSVINLGPKPLRGGSIDLPPGCPPSVLTSLLLVAPYAVIDVFIRTASPPARDMGDVLNLMDRFGASTVSEAPRFIIPAAQCYDPTSPSKWLPS